MNVDFEDRLRSELAAEQVDVPLDEDAVLAQGRASVRNRRVGWGLAGIAALAVVALAVPAIVSRSTAGVVAPVASPSASTGSGVTVPLPKEVLGSTIWRLATDTGDWVGTAPMITFVADGDRIEGRLGCGTYAGEFADDGRIQARIATVYRCKDGAGAADDRYLETLNGVTTYEFASDPERLSLDGSMGTLVFRPYTDGVTWQVTRLGGKTRTDSGLTLVIDGNQVHGGSVCVDYTADLARDGQAWSVNNRQLVRGTEAPCPSTSSEDMNRYFDLLDQVTHARVELDKLTLAGPNGSIEFTRKA